MRVPEPDRAMRLRQVVASLLLCAVTLGMSACAPVTRVLTEIYAPGAADDRTRAVDPADIPYASIRLTVDGTGGLLLMTEQVADRTFWRSGGLETVVLDQGDLARTEGLNRDLLLRETAGRRFAPGARSSYGVRIMANTPEQPSKGLTGRATLSCDAATRAVSLPLVELSLYRCVERVEWRDKGSTESVYQISPVSGRIWQASVRAFPSSPRIEWMVARPWWTE